MSSVDFIYTSCRQSPTIESTKGKEVPNCNRKETTMTTLAQVHHATVNSARKFDYTEDSMLQKGDEVPAEVLDMMKRVCLVKHRGHFDRRPIDGVTFEVKNENGKIGDPWTSVTVYFHRLGD